MHRKFSGEQINILKQYYPTGDWDSILPFFPNMKIINIRALARRIGIKQNERQYTSHIDITGQRFGRLTAIRLVELKKRNGPFWLCKCDCGNESTVSFFALISGGTKSCGCLRHKTAWNALDLTGQKFGLLTAVQKIPNYNSKGTYYRCECECGRTDVFVASGNLRSGHTVSCSTHNHKRIEYKVLKNLDDKENNYSVYRHIAPNGKSYIGITKQDAERRFQDGIGYKSQAQFWRAIKKYGWSNFQHEILESGLTEKEASEREVFYIKKYNAFAPNGYNVAEGGITGKKAAKPIIQYYNGKPVNFFKSSREATKALGIALATIKRHLGENRSVGGYYFEQLPLMFANEIPEEYLALKDTNHYNIDNVIGYHLKQTTVKRNLSGVKSINKYELSGKYICTYPSIASAKASIEGSSGEAISAAVNPNRQGGTAYGFMWKYNTGDYSDIAPFKYKVQRAVQQIDIKTGEIVKEYRSLSEASKAIHSHSDNIVKVCRGEKASWKGYSWKIIE